MLSIFLLGGIFIALIIGVVIGIFIMKSKNKKDITITNDKFSNGIPTNEKEKVKEISIITFLIFTIFSFVIISFVLKTSVIFTLFLSIICGGSITLFTMYGLNIYYHNHDEKKKDSAITNDDRTPIILISISLIISLVSMIIMFLKVNSDFYKSVFLIYLAILIPNLAILILGINKKNKLKNFKTKSIILLCVSIIYVIVASILYTRFYNEHIQDMNNKKEELLKEYKCETQYDDGRWINGKCYYKDHHGRTKTTTLP